MKNKLHLMGMCLWADLTLLLRRDNLVEFWPL